ncbi:MAG: hypothetical protein AAB909_01135 [Patescibacteria group bacterium]
MNVVVSNIRVPENKYKMWKDMAADEGVSINTFLIKGMDKIAKDKQLGVDANPFDRIRRAAKLPNKPMGWSDEDAAIYG